MVIPSSFRRGWTASLLVTLLLQSACDSSEKSRPSSVPSAETAPVAKEETAAPKTAPVAPAPAAPKLGIDWDVPEGWKEDLRPRMMRAATYNTPGSGGPAEVSVFYFGVGQGGDVEANIERWVGQFQNVSKESVKRSESATNGLKRFRVSIAKGDFSSGMPGQTQGVQSNWGMEGAIVETPSGSYYFKMFGPAASVQEQISSFEALLDSIKIKG